jgi:hypothetical protein
MTLLLERILYEKAPSLETYCDLASLDDRIHEITGEKYLRAIDTAAKPTNPKGKSRDEFLREVLEGPRYEMARKLIKEIKLCKLRRGAKMNCASTRRKCGRPATMLDRASARQSLPQSLYKLFFKTPLIVVFETFPVQRLKEQNWNALLEQAIHNLRAYKSYIKSGGAD